MIGIPTIERTVVRDGVMLHGENDGIIYPDFTEEFQKVIKETVAKAKYSPNEDPVLIEHKRKIRRILGRSI